jgi:hypothetical protein
MEWAIGAKYLVEYASDAISKELHVEYEKIKKVVGCFQNFDLQNKKNRASY